MADATTDVEEVIKSLRGSLKADYLRVSTHKNLVQFLSKNGQTAKDLEAVEFSDSALKINKRGKEQERHLVITNLAIYNFLPSRNYSKAQRAIPITRLKGVALCRDSDEVLFQVLGEYDYRFRIVRRAEMVETLTRAFEKLTGSPLNVKFSDDLAALQVTKDDLRRSKPKAQARRESEAKAALSGGPSSPHSPTAGGAHSSSAVSRTGSATLSRRRSMASLEEGSQSIQGWLAKRGKGGNEIWRKRYFRLGESNLLYYDPRTKGSVQLICGEGLVHAWKNNRYDVLAREALEPSTPNHLRDILRDEERQQCFLLFCKQIYCEENANFFVEVDHYRDLPEDSKEQEQKALHIYKTYVEQGAPMEISAPVDSRQEAKDDLWKKNMTPHLFDRLQHIVLSIMRVDLLPRYLAYAAENLAKAEVDYKLKQSLTEDDKKAPQCQGCTSAFSLMRRRNICQYCNKVFCASCLSKQSSLPEPFDVKKGTLVRVCDVCFGILNPSPHIRYAFTYCNTSTKPLNLAAESQAELLKWLSGLRSILMPKAKGEAEEEYHLESWLWKEDPATQQWRRRYFVLDKYRLWYYEMSLKGSIPIGQGLGVHPTTTVQPTLTEETAHFGGFTSKSLFSYRFNISSNDRIFHVAADSEEDMHYWIDAIRAAVQGDLSIYNDDDEEEEAFADSVYQKAPEGEVTFVFTDVQNSTRLWEADPDSMSEALEKHDFTLRELLKKLKGYEVKTEGDAFMIAFFTALDAILWCIAVQKQLMKVDWPQKLLTVPAAAKEDDAKGEPLFNGVRIRMGIHTGHPSCRRNPTTGRMDYFGPVVNRASRVADSGHGGQVVATEEVIKALKEAQHAGTFTENVVVHDLGDHMYKGVSEPVHVYQIAPIELAGRTFPPLRTDIEKKPVSERDRADK